MLIRLNAAELKGVFKDIKPIYKNCQDGALMGFNVDNYNLYITCSNGVVYEQHLPCEHPGPYSLTVLYQDLSELLPGRGVVDLELAPLYVSITSEFISATLQRANSDIARYRQRAMEFSQIDPSIVRGWASVFSETSTISKSLKREAAVVFKPPHAIIKFPTFWLQLQNNILDTSMSLNVLKAIAEFAPTEFATTDSAIEFRRRNATLSVQRTPIETCEFIDSITSDHEAPVTLRGQSYLPRIQQFLRSVGAGRCRCYFYRSGIEVVVSRPKVQSSLRIGECDAKIAVIDTFLEYVQMFFRLCGEQDVTITSGKKSIQLSTTTLSMVLSIM